MNLGEWIVVGIAVTVVVGAAVSWGGKHPRAAEEIDAAEAEAARLAKEAEKKL
jgi:hypothetical protein